MGLAIHVQFKQHQAIGNTWIHDKTQEYSRNTNPDLKCGKTKL